MSEYDTNSTPETEIPEIDNIEQDTAGTEQQDTSKITVEYILQQIAAVQADTAHIKEALLKLGELTDEGFSSQSDAIAKVVTARETTNQNMIAFYEKVYEDIRPVSPAMEWSARLTREATRAAEKAKSFGGKVGDKVKVFLNDLSDDAYWSNLGSRAAEKLERKNTLRSRVLSALKDPALDDDDRDLIIESAALLKTLSPDMLDEAFSVLTDATLSAGEKRSILQKFDAISELDD